MSDPEIERLKDLAQIKTSEAAEPPEMNYYTVNATLVVPAWITLEAESPEAALQEARDYRASDFDYDVANAEVEFNVTPEVEPA